MITSMQLRIFSGKLKYRAICAPKTRLTRPATSRLRQVIFSTIAPYLQEAHVLDLFAGSGILATEAISLGAKSAMLIEIGTIAFKTIQKNIKALDLEKQMQLKKSSAMQFLKQTRQTFDIIFLDPPYTFEPLEYAQLLETILERKLIRSSGIIVLELEDRVYAAIDKAIFTPFMRVKEKKLGSTILNVLKPL